ncbi:hypothetical protein WMY93_018366 [Mugilogobius chulae]|uniref:VPS10 domain-containing protein n=1 Tax=Mugilogobius chulae TaxID=88201 RepID=A0AAW0NUL4_9GOBI
METRPSHWFIFISSEWIWLIVLTSLLGVTKAEVRCIPSCQLPPVTALPQELSALDLISFDELQSEEIDRSVEALSERANGGNINYIDTDQSEESSSKVKKQSKKYNDASNKDEKLLKVPTSSDSSELDGGNRTQNISGENGESKVEDWKRSNGTENEDKVVTDVRQSRGRGARSAETWSEFRQEDTGVDASDGALVWAEQQRDPHVDKYYDFNTGRVTESSLWRSTDYGATYEKLNERVGLKTILSYLYVSPNNKRKIMLLTDPEVENSLLISLDEGASYQRHSLAFDILSLLFHPEQEDWILAYSHDQKLYVSVEFGRRWQLVHDNVVPNRFYWSKLGLDKEQGMIHLEISVTEGRSQYITCKLQNCTEGNKGKPFPGFIIPNSLVVQDEYVFIQVPIGIQSVHYVSYKRNAFYPMKLPKYTVPKDLQIISTDDNQVVAAIQDWHQNDSYHLYMSESRGLFFTLMLESVVSSGGPEGNIMIDLYEVAGIKGVFLSNKIVENQVKTYITYNKGRDWRLLQAPTTDLQGNKVYCEQPHCSLHLHLHVFQEEYSVFFLNQGGSLVAIRHTPLPIRHIWLSFDEGRNWDKYSFTSSLLYVDGVLGEPGEDTLIMTIFGHFSHRSEWQLVKVDFRSIFQHRCTSDDYTMWQVHDQSEACIMGMKRVFQKLKANARCVKARDQYVPQKSDSCPCTEADFECDYGFERHSDGSCTPSFWFIPSATSRDCITGDTFLNTTGYRKALSNNCTEGRGNTCGNLGKERHLPGLSGRGPQFHHQYHSGLRGRDCYIVRKHKLHRRWRQAHYSKVGIYQVSATASNSLGSDKASLYLHVTCPLEQVQLSAPSVAVKNKPVNLTTTLRPSQAGTVTYYWWFDNRTEPVVTLNGAMTYTFSKVGSHTVTVQASLANTVHQDQMIIAVYDYFRSHVLAFSSNLDELNPGVSEWREDIGRVVKNSIVQVTGISENQLLVAVLPGLPTTAELYLLPEKGSRGGAVEEKWANLDQLSQVLLSALNQDLVQLALKPGVQVNVYATRLSPAPLVDSSEIVHSSTAIIMLVSVILMVLAIFVLYKFKRKIPGINTYTAEQPDKEQEVIPTVTSIAEPDPQGDKLTSLDRVDVHLDSKSRGYLPSHADIKLSDEAPHVF